MFDRLSIRTKLIAIVAAPLAVIVVLAGLGFTELRAEAESTRADAARLEALAAAQALQHELQLESLLSVQFLAAGDDASPDALEEQRGAVDEAAARFDPKWTGEAVCNLLDNAVKYTPAGGRVTVSVTPYELFCRIDVADTGPGLGEEEQAKVFQRFYRAPAARDREGVGIGLYLVRQIAAGQGGYVKVDSAPGRGSVFSLFLPQ